MRKIVFILLSLGLVFTWACEKTIEIDIEATKPRLVLNAVINPDSTIAVFLSRSMHILDNQNVMRITNARVFFYEDDIEIAEMQHVENGMYVCDYYPKIGKKYSVKASAKDFDDIKASCEIVPPVSITQIDTLTTYDEYNNPNLVVDINFKDPPEQGNYYIIHADMQFTSEYIDYSQFRVDTLYQNQDTVIIDTTWGILVKNKFREVVGLNSDDMIVEQIYLGGISGFIFSDEIINSQSYAVKFNLSIYSWVDTDELKYTFYFKSISRDYYYYLRTLNAHHDAVNDPFAEPVFVHSNVENGIGVFGSFTQDVDSIIIDPSRFEYNWYYK
ncbi:MAG: DUF4249 domain-containing protein [Bacteroidales bacterium]|nr:DUF4249 domain-containing protein [Bacteroidales bacterium]